MLSERGVVRRTKRFLAVQVPHPADPKIEGMTFSFTCQRERGGFYGSVFQSSLFSSVFPRLLERSVRGNAACPILAIAALCMALKWPSLRSGFRWPTISIYFTYLITAAQCAVCGPVVGVLCGGIGDLIEFAIHPNGPFFPGYTLSSMAGALILLYFFTGQKSRC